MLTFKPCGMFGKELHRVEGHIQDRRYVHVHVRADAVNTQRLRSTVCFCVCETVRRNDA